MDEKGGIENEDVGALTNEQQSKLNEFKTDTQYVMEIRKESRKLIKTRLDNEKYLRDHPEAECLLTSFISEVLKKRPENVREFASEYFTSPELPLKIQAQVQNKLSKVKHSQENAHKS